MLRRNSISGVCQFKIFLHHQQAGDQFLPAIEEGLHIGVGVADDAFGGIGVLLVEGEFFFEIAVVGLEVDVVDFWQQQAFQQPGFVDGGSHETEGAGGEYPFEVGGDVVAFDAEDVFVLQLLDYAHEAAVVGLADGLFVYAADIALGMVVVLVQEAQALFLMGGAAPDELVAFGGKGGAVGVDVEVAHAVELEQNRVLVIAPDGAAFHESRLGGDVGNVAEFVGEAGFCRKVAQEGGEVVVVGGGVATAFEVAGLAYWGEAT